MSRRVISLSSDSWQFGPVSRRPFLAANVFDLPAVVHWQPATVPGNVRTDLLALGRIPDPFVAEGYKASLWVEDVDWWYRRQVQVDDLASDQRAFVRFHGIDYLSAVFVNGVKVARHEGMFSHQWLDVTGAARAGQFELAVRVWGSSALPRRRLSAAQRWWKNVGRRLYRSWVGIYPDRTATLKCQMSFGWDFAPPIRTMGIWDEVELIVTGPMLIQGLGVRIQESGGGDLSLSPQLALHAAASTATVATVTVTPANFQADAAGPFRFSLGLPAGQSDLSLRCSLPRVARWQPWDRGFPHLYDVTVMLTTPGGVPLDSIGRRTGFRTVEKRGWRFVINGQPEFVRGLNWVPADSFPGRLRPADYRHRLQQARDSGANLLRVWGGGLREKAAFYDLCDELGLLVWQEFPFACEFLGAFPRHRAYLDFVTRECGDIVRQLQLHPSVVLWCGGNEFSRQRNRPLLRTLAHVVRRYDGTRPFIPTSPGPGDAHNWQVWHGYAPIAAYRQEKAPFLSEFGLQALPTLKTLTAVLGDLSGLPKLTGLVDAMFAHHGDPGKLARYTALFNEQLTMSNEQLTINNDDNLAGNYAPDNFTHAPLVTRHSQLKIYNSQLAQAVALQTAIEHMRRRKGQAGGVCLWQFNEPWPAVSWAIIDYFGRPKLAYRRLKSWYAPLLVSLDFPVGRRWQPGDTFAATIWLINDSLTAINNYQLTIRNSVSNSPLYTQTGGLAADTAICVGQFSHQFTTVPPWLTVSLHQGERLLCQNSYPLHWHDDRGGSRWQALRRRLARLALW